MRLDSERLRDLLADGWERWGHRCAELTDEQWSTPTRCDGWDVRALVAHVCPSPELFDTLSQAVVDQPPAVTDAAEMLRRFNASGGVAHTNADDLARTAVAEAKHLSAESAVARFRECARIARSTPMPQSTVVAYPAIGSTTLAVIVEVAVMETTVHLLDLAAAVGGVEPSPAALAATRDLLIAVPDPTAAIEVLAGRAAPESAVPAIR